MEKKNLLLMYNASAGKGRVSEELFEGIEYLSVHGYEVTIYPIVPSEKLTSESILHDLSKKYDVVMVFGGDGTLNHAINGLMMENNMTPIGYVPVGSTNDFSKSIYGGHGKSVLDVCKYIVEGKTLTYDIGKFNDTYFNYVAGFGAFPEVSYTTPQDLKNNLGYVAYVLQFLSAIPDGLSYKTHCVIEHDGIVDEGDYMFGLITNSISVAGMQPGLIKQSSLTDGQFEVMLIKSNLNASDLPSILSALNDQKPQGDAITSFHVKNATFTFDKEVPWTLDGEDGGLTKRVELSVVPEKISIFVPENTSL